MLSDERLEEIRRKLIMRRDALPHGEVRLDWDEVADLVDEVDRLRVLLRDLPCSDR
jgi:hypothetical protein